MGGGFWIWGFGWWVVGGRPALGLEPGGVGARPGRVPLPRHGPVLPRDAVLFGVGLGELPELGGAVGAHIAQLQHLGLKRLLRVVHVRAPKVAAEDRRKVDVRKVERLEREVEAAGVK